MTIIASEPSPADFVAALDRASTRRTTSSDAGTLVWRIWGSGPPLVLLHGGTGSWMHWVRNIEDLSSELHADRSRTCPARANPGRWSRR